MNDLIIPKKNGTYIKVKLVTVEYDYVNSDGTPMSDVNGHVDSGGNVVLLDAVRLSKLPSELLVQALLAFDEAEEVEAE